MAVSGSKGAPTRALAHGSKLWIGLALYIAIADGLAAIRRKETMSMAFWRAVCHPYHRPWVTAVWVYITLHLYHALPGKYDPLRILIREASTN